jgi:hypothetical protein
VAAICTSGDNCPLIDNNDQANGDGFFAGDACQCGDATGDGLLTAQDYERLREHVVGATLGGPLDADRCDLDGDADCDVEDLVPLQRALGAASADLTGCPAWAGP